MGRDRSVSPGPRPSSHRDRDDSPPSRRDRSRSRSRSPRRSASPPSRSSHDRDREGDRDRKKSKHHRRDRDRDEESEEEEGSPPDGVARISAQDYFLKSNEFKLWLDEEKRKRLDQLRSDDARKYFKKFVKKWNRGDLNQKYYSGISGSQISASVSSGYSWNFSKATQRELDDASSIRKSIDTSFGRSSSSRAPPSTSTSTRPSLGPSLPPPSSTSALESLHSSRETSRQSREDEKSARKAEYKRAAREEKEERSGATGRERMLEKRAEGNAVRREIREGREEGWMEVDEGTLMGESGSFKDMIAARDRAKSNGKRAMVQQEKAAAMSDKVQQFRTKEQETMDQFRKLAAERFGPL